ncbi:hypothetical protein BDV41DRAFT_555237 [Aspergillus transmontanensis]|uniref:Uncharacterized protein n=1 Tax=Aspergillus transmontanensis TaxID=1034304 RepID=A0A5N6VFQ7_9EURO|nr:hypothetical protein BDV41DRAFT_555237 [Aspergillus transmontanensis]
MSCRRIISSILSSGGSPLPSWLSCVDANDCQLSITSSWLILIILFSKEETSTVFCVEILSFYLQW